MTYDILIVDDEADIRNLICDVLQDDEKFDTRTAANDLDALKLLDDKVPTVVILDVWLQGSELDGLGILEIIKKKYPYLPVIIISGHGNIETAVNAIKIGAYDYIEKPFTEDKLIITVKRACEVAKLQKENATLRMYAVEAHKLIGNSPAMNVLKQSILKVAPTSSRVLITGPHGSGKKLVAKLLHEKSKRKNQPFIVFSATGMSEEKAQLEIFGEESKDVFADPRKVGVLELAHMGTLFLDEVADLPLNVQSKILNFLQNGNFFRNGSKNVTKLDVRIISSSSKDLKKEIIQGKFREDLYYRLNVIEIKVPSLMERKDDIQILSDFFLYYFHQYSGFPLRKLATETLIALQNYAWPGNVRQLRNVIEWLLIMSDSTIDNLIAAEALPPELLNNSTTALPCNVSNAVEISASQAIDLSLRDAREVFEKQYLTSQLARFGSNITKMANFIGMERSALHRKLKSLGISNNDE